MCNVFKIPIPVGQHIASISPNKSCLSNSCCNCFFFFCFLKFLPRGSLKLRVEENLFIFPSKCSLCVGCSHIFLESELQSLTFFSKMLLEATLVGS